MKPARKQREKILPQAKGDVLELGIGSGLNLMYYDPERVRHVVGIDTLQEIWDRRDLQLIDSLSFDVDFVRASAADMPFESGQFDSVVVTYTLCSIKDLQSVFNEVRRVLKSGGELYFCEHGKAPDERVYRTQKRIDPVWGLFSGGCSLKKDIPRLIRANGFVISELKEMYIPGWKPGSYNYWGQAKPA